MPVQMMRKNRTPSSPTAIILVSPYVTSFSPKYSNAQKERPAQICPHGSKLSRYHTQTSRMLSHPRNSSSARLWAYYHQGKVRGSGSSSLMGSESCLRCCGISRSWNSPRSKSGRKAHSVEYYLMALAHSNHKGKDQQKGQSLMSQKAVRPSLGCWEVTGARMMKRVKRPTRH